MSDSNERLSERLREQVSALHEQAAPVAGLDRDAQRRVVQRLVAEASRLQRQRKRRLQLAAAGTTLLLAAAAVLLYVRAPEPQPAAAPQASAAPQPEAACALPQLASADLAAEAGVTFALGALGELVTQPNSRLSVEHSSPCELALRLHSGTLAGDLHSLRPAKLLIRTDHGEVVVTGTRFSVRSDSESALEVLLENGVVDVELKGEGKLRMQPRTRLRKRADKASSDREGLSSADVQRLAGWLQPPPRAAEPVAAAAPEPTHKPAFESSSAALMAAEAARRAERWSTARDAYKFASQGKDGNAEVGLLRWARFELDQTAAAQALRLVAEHKRRFPHGVLGAESAWIEVQARTAVGQDARAKKAARKLVERHADSPQAAAARKLLEAE
jgi:hypothetical protein